MDIRQAKQEIANTLRAYHRRDDQGNWLFPRVRQRPILLMGPPGIGKTAIMAQIAQELEVGLVAYSMTHHTRQSAIGLPRIETRRVGERDISVTEYTLSEIIASIYDCMERTGKKEGILFLDEINCVSETLVPAMLQLLQNKTFGNHPVPEGWMIVAAGNPAGYNRSVREFDIVTLDRLRRIDVEPQVDVWLEYARRQGVHGAILSWLSIHPEEFYRVELGEEQSSFVTARGWEDLSELIHGYEALEVPVTENVIRQYLQHEGAARRFGAYYRLYRQYGMDYPVQDILNGTAVDLDGCVSMAAKAGMEERFTVVNMLSDALCRDMNGYVRDDRFITELHEMLSVLSGFMKQGSLDEFIAQRRAGLSAKAGANLLTPARYRQEDVLLRSLEEYALIVHKEHITEPGAVFQRIKELFGAEREARRETVAEMHRRLNRAFAFVERAFGGDSGEVLLFVSSLAHSEAVMSFVSRHGSDDFLRYSGKLLYQEQELALQEQCRQILKEV